MMAQVEAVERVAFAPITRIDAAAREIEVTATSEALDAYGTVFDYAASKDAFQRWMGNVREMHANVAVGKRMAVICDDAARQIRVRLKISRGAASTWEKILDGTLCGASIGATNVVWRETRRTDGGGTPLAEPVRVATAYDLVELSLVDNPANPDCVGIAVMRGLVADEEVLDEIEGDGPTPDPSPSADGEGRRGPTPDPSPSADGEGRRGPTPDPAPSEMERGDAGRDEVGQERDESCPYKEQREMTGQGGRGTEAGVVEARVLAAARNAATGVALLRGVVERMAAEQAAALDEVRARLARIEAQPMPGGPMLRAAEKVLGAPMGNPAMNVAERIAALQEFGAGRTDQRAQVEVAAEILRLQRGFGE